MKKLTRDDLKEMYYSMTNKKLCQKLGISNATLTTLLVENGIEFKTQTNRVNPKKIIIVD